MSTDTGIKQRRQQADYLNIGDAEEPEFVFMGRGFTELNEEPGAQTKSRRYINDATSTSSITGYESTFPFNADQIPSEKAIKFIVDVGKYRKTGAESETQYVAVDLDDPVPEQANKFNARMFQVAIEVSSFTDDEGEYTCEGNLNQKGDPVVGVFDTTTSTFEPSEDTSANAIVGRSEVGEATV